MRKIKFRGKNLFTGEWVYGYYKRNRHGENYIEDTDGIVTLVSENTVGELVYISDTGKEVYEGDYVSFYSGLHDRQCIYLVEYDMELQQFRAVPQNNSPRYWEIGFSYPIGNRYDNKIEDLMEDKR